jgi:hypothetical protein
MPPPAGDDGGTGQPAGPPDLQDEAQPAAQPAAPRARFLDPARPATRMLRVALGVIALLVSLRVTIELLLIPIWGVDVVIPLRAAARWLAGGQPYLASSFQAGSGYDVPYLYPPLFLPPFAVLAQLPWVPVIVAVNVLCALAAIVALRRLGLPVWLVALAFVWPPVAGTIQGGNLQLPLFAAFVLVYWAAPRRPFRSEPRIPGQDGRPALADGLLAGIIPAVKVSQAHAWVGLLRLRPRAALAGLAALAILAVAMLPLTGIGLWQDWLAQSARAADPAWALAGAGLTGGLPPMVTLGVAVLSMAACLVVPPARAGLWIGLLTTIGAPSLRMYGLLLIIPAMLEIRRELALVAAILVATYTAEGMWLGIALVTGANLLAGRVPALREPGWVPA